jgi:hypothetical protein
MNRFVDIKPVNLKKLEGFKGIPNDGMHDGILFISLLEDETDLKKSLDLLVNDSLKDPRILVAIPKQPIHFSYVIRKYNALNYVRDDNELFGQDSAFKDECIYRIEECMGLIKKILFPALNLEKNMLNYYWKGELVKGITSQAKLENLTTEMMKEAYPYTQLVLRDELKKIEGRDTFKKHREPVIDNLFREDGPDIIANEVNKPVKSVIDSVLKANKVLVRKAGKWIITKPTDMEAMVKVWEEIENFVLSSKSPGQPFSFLINKILSPPFGLRPRSIPVIVAAPLRKYVLKGNITLKEGEMPWDKIDGDLIEKAVTNPDKYYLVYAEVGEGQKAIVSGLCGIFEIEPADELGETVLILIEKMISWWTGLPNYARKTSDLSDRAKALREKVFIQLTREGIDKKSILFTVLPDVIGLADIGKTSENAILEQINIVGQVKQEFEMAVKKLNEMIVETFKGVFGDKESNPIESLNIWYESLGSKKDLVISGDAGRLLEACRKIKGAKDEVAFIDLATKITGSKPEDWNNFNVLGEFKGQLKNVRKTIEEYSVPEIPEPTSPPISSEYFVLSLVIDGKIVKRQFKKAPSISQIGTAMGNLIRDAINGIGSTLSDEEKFTILVEVLSEQIK